jgi:hypothetical protein
MIKTVADAKAGMGIVRRRRPFGSTDLLYFILSTIMYIY